MGLATIGKALIILVAVLIAAGGTLAWRSTLETVTPLITLNPSTSGPRAIVVYSPGISDFHSRMVDAFTSGLTESSWSVDTVTASSQATVNLSGYSLLVFGGPLYGGRPSKPIQGYMERLTSLKGLHVFILLTAGGSAHGAEEAVADWVSERGGVVLGRLTLFSMAPNDAFEGATDPVQIAFKAAQSITK